MNRSVQVDLHEPAFGDARGAVVILSRVDQLLNRAVEAASNIASAPITDPLRGLFVSDADAGRLINRGAEPLRQVLDFERPLVDVTTAGPRWRRIANAFALAPFELDVMALALAPELDLRYEKIFGYLHDDITKRWLTPDLAAQLLCSSFDERLAVRQFFTPDAALLRYHLVQLVEDPNQLNGSCISHAIKLDNAVIDFLLGAAVIDGRLGQSAHLEVDPAVSNSAAAIHSVDTMLSDLRDVVRGSQRFALLGPDRGLKLEVARRAARELEQPLLVIDLPALLQLGIPFGEAVAHVARSGQLNGALLIWLGGDQLLRGDADAAARLDTWVTAVAPFALTHLVAAADARGTAGTAHEFVRIELPLPDAAAREDHWLQRLAACGVALPHSEIALLADVFRMDAGAIERAIEQALRTRQHVGSDTAITCTDLFAAARAQILSSLPRYATRMAATQHWDDIVLPPDHLLQLRELCDRVRHRRTVLETWGFERRLTLGRGIAALFAGPSGTGKTMAAQIIAGTLGMDLYRVEIPAVVSKYIGETEKALDQLFREAQGTSVILFFDEADALFGKRSEVKDAHDRYANIEISYLLQAIEQYDGLTILATNLRHNVDDAFVRRLAFSITFPFPEENERRRIWQKSWPAQLPLADDIDFDFLARQFKLAGGNIRNVTLAAAFCAAADGGRVNMAHIVRGVRREFQKMGKICVESEFGRYFELLEN